MKQRGTGAGGSSADAPLLMTEEEQDNVISKVVLRSIATRRLFGYVLFGAGLLLATMQAGLGLMPFELELVSATALWLGAASFSLSAAVACANLETWGSFGVGAGLCWALAFAPAAATLLFGVSESTTGPPETLTGEQQVITWILLPLGPLLFAGTCHAVSRTAGTSEEGLERLKALRYGLKGA